MLAISWLDLYFFCNQPKVFINSASVPKFITMFESYTCKDFIVPSTSYRISLLFWIFFITTSLEVLNMLFDLSITYAILFLFLISAIIILFSNFIISESFPFSIKCKLLSYMHINFSLSWYLICVISSPAFPAILCSTELVGSLFAFSIEIIFIFDCTIAPVVSISAIAKYWLFPDISVAIAILEDRYVLNNSFPSELNITTIFLYEVPFSTTDTYPFLLTLIFSIVPSTEACHKRLPPDTK